MSKIGEGGYQPAANQTGIVLPTFQDWYNQAAADKYDYKLEHRQGQADCWPGGLLHRQAAEAEVITVSGYTDWDASLQEIKQQLRRSAST